METLWMCVEESSGLVPRLMSLSRKLTSTCPNYCISFVAFILLREIHISSFCVRNCAFQTFKWVCSRLLNGTLPTLKHELKWTSDTDDRREIGSTIDQ